MVYFVEVDITISGTITPTGDRSVDNHHFARSLETWMGYILPLDTTAQEKFIAEAKKLFEKEEDVYTEKKEFGVCVWGHMETPNQEKLEGLVQEYEVHIKRDPIRVIGDYFRLLGDSWVEEAMKKPKQGSLF